MSRFNYTLFFLFLISHQISILCAVPAGFTDISLASNQNPDLKATNPMKYYYSVTSGSLGSNNILKITSKPDSYSYPGYLYASFSSDISEDKNSFSSKNSGINELYIDLTGKTGTIELYILLKAPKVKDTSTKVTLSVNIIQNIDIANGYSSRDSISSFEKIFIFSYDSNQIETNKILHVSCIPEDFSYPGYLYASFERNINEDTRQFSSQKLGNNELYIDLSQYKEKTKLYILVKPPKKENDKYITFNTNLIPRIELTGYNVNARFKLNHINEVILLIIEF